MPHAKSAAPNKKGKERRGILFLIAVFKLAKGLVLVAVGIGAIHFLHRDLAQTVNHWINVLRIDPDNRFIHRFLTRILRVSPKQLKAVSAGTFLYAGLFLTEGTGLLLAKRWAEYFTIITTGSLIPLEVYELVERFTAVRLLILAVNAAILVYLVVRVRRTT